MVKMRKAQKEAKQMISKRPVESIPDDIKAAVGVLSIDPDHVTPMGSWTFRSQLYPGDIDLMEITEQCCSATEANIFFASALQKVIIRILKTSGMYLGDMKAGLDYRYKLDLGTLSYNKTGQPKIFGYDQQKISTNIQDLHTQGLLDQKETEELLALTIAVPNASQYESLYNKLRDKWVLRWSADEILQGYKMLPGNQKLSFTSAIMHPSIIKIDIWTNVYGRFMEVTNVFVLYYKNPAGKKFLLNLKQVDIIEEMKKEVQKYAFSPANYKPFKLVKRMWSLARLMKDYKMISILTTITQSDAGRLSQIASDIDTIISIVENIQNPPVAQIKKELDFIRYRLSNVYEIKYNIKTVSQYLTRTIRSSNLKTAINDLHVLKDYFTQLVGDYTLKLLLTKKLYPPPSKYLPKLTAL
jgi:hypothetical protein